MPALVQLQGEDSTSDVSEVTLSSVGSQPPALRLGKLVAGVVYITVHFTWASNGHSAPQPMCATTGSTSPFILRILWLALTSYCVELRSISGFGGKSLPDIRSRQSHWRIHGRRELTSCGAPNAAATAALAADLSLDSLIDCSNGRSLSVFRQLASWHLRLPSWCPVVCGLR